MVTRRLDDLSFEELVQALAELDRADELDLEQTIDRTKIDRRLMRLLSEQVPESERRTTLRVPGPLGVRLHIGERAIDATIVDLGEGGLRVNAPGAIGEVDTVEVELLAGPALAAAEQPPRARARVTWRKPAAEGVDLGLQFVAQPSAHKRRMRRVVLGILRRLPSRG